MVVTGFIRTFVGCVISTGDCLILKPITDTIVRVRDEDNLVLAAYVESEESNIYWFGSGNRQISDYDHLATITREKNKIRVQLGIWRVDRFLFNSYLLKRFDVWINGKLSWTVMDEVIPEQHLWVKASTTCSIDEPDLNCQNSPHGHVTWEYSGCNVTISDVNHKIVCEFDKCEEISKLDYEERKRRLLEEAERGNIIKILTLLMMGTSVSFESEFQESPLCTLLRKGYGEATQLRLVHNKPGTETTRTRTEILLK
ncbi:uncharacterized protein [Periplaneta americana]|uniref:uncharacterized protein n=1 Tax=Periplaneta americana TaxID=6978 RepID=UPI0037E7927F